ncbi:MAG: hypothetical protein HN790_13495 [Methylococcales bacterium]|jgi:hypothetical protein|nr:hypothetical protein [Methylococcales bacterium]
MSEQHPNDEKMDQLSREVADIKKIVQPEPLSQKEKIRALLKDYIKEVSAAVVVGVLVTLSMIFYDALFEDDRSSSEQIAPVSSAGAETLSANTTQTTQRHYMLRSQFVSVLSGLVVIKTTVTEFYMMRGEMPSDLKGLGFVEEDFTEIALIDRLKIAEGGMVEASLSAVFGEGKIVRLMPKLSASGMRIHWRCETNVAQRVLGVPGATCHHIE